MDPLPDDDFARGWLDTEVGRQVQPVVRRGVAARLRRWLRALRRGLSPDR